MTEREEQREMEQTGPAERVPPGESVETTQTTQAPHEHQADDWEWRRKIRANAHSHRIYKWVVGVVGTIVTVVGLITVPAPGPGWLIVFVGIGILASEFEWAQRLLTWGKERLKDWNDWLAPKPLWFKGLFGLATLALVLAIFYGLFLLSGVPGFIPDVAENWIKDLPGL